MKGGSFSAGREIPNSYEIYEVVIFFIITPQQVLNPR